MRVEDEDFMMSQWCWCLTYLGKRRAERLLHYKLIGILILPFVISTSCRYASCLCHKRYSASLHVSRPEQDESHSSHCPPVALSFRDNTFIVANIDSRHSRADCAFRILTGSPEVVSTR
jgi:hypothetical protein